MANAKIGDQIEKQQYSCLFFKLLSLFLISVVYFPRLFPLRVTTYSCQRLCHFRSHGFQSCQNGGHPWFWRCIALYLPGRTEDRALRMISPNHHFQFSKLPRMPRSHYTKSPPGSARLIPSNDRQDRDRVGRGRIWEEAGRVGKRAAMEVWDGKGGKCLMFRSPFPSSSQWVGKDERWQQGDNKSWMRTPQHKECPRLHIGSTV